MSIVKFKVPCVIKNKISNDIYGEPVFGSGINSFCAVIKLNKIKAATTVRVDSSGTRGHADEQTLDAKLLIKPNAIIDLDDFISVSGMTMKVSAIRQQFSIGGRLDHIEVVGTIE